MKRLLLVVFSLFIKCLLEASVLISSIQYVNEDGETQPEGHFVYSSGELSFYLTFKSDKINDDGEVPFIEGFTITGSPTLNFKIGTDTRRAKLVSADSNIMLFQYEIQPDDLGFVQFAGNLLLRFAYGDSITANLIYDNGEVGTDTVVKIPYGSNQQMTTGSNNPVTKFNEWYGSSDAAENYIWVKIEPYLTCEDSLVTGEGDQFDYAELSINRAPDSSVTYTIEYPLDANGNPLISGPATLEWPANQDSVTLSKLKALDNFETNIVLRGDNGIVFSLPVVATNEAPHINSPWEGNIFEGRIGEVLSFSASASDVVSEIYDPLTYVWDFGDGKGHVLGQNVTYSYTDGGTYLITLTVNDDDGGVVSCSYQTHITCQEEGADGIVWTYIVKNGEAEIYGDVNTSAIPEETTGAITIPSMLGGYPVMKIGDFAFSGCYNLTNITIPDSVTSIGYRAFEGCSGLTSVTIPDSVTSIEDYAFRDCSGLTSVTIGNSVTSIGDSAFDGCSDLTSVTIGNSVTSIGGDAFFGCSGLTSITIPDSVTYIGHSAFRYCSGLTSITIPDSVTSIGYGAFSYCSGLTKFIVDSNNPNYKSVNGLLLSKDGKTLIAGINGNVVIPDSVTSIGSSAFNGCYNLTSLTIPDSVTSIGDSAFRGCSGLTNVTIPDSVTSIGISVFGWCSGLTSITIPDSVTSIGDDAFFNCDGLTSIAIPDSITSIGDSAFKNCDGLTSVTIPNSVTYIGSRAFDGCSGLTSVTIPNSVTSIGSFAFDGCSGLTSVTIPDSVTSIDYSAFYGCSGLTSVTIPNSVTSIGSRAFFGCRGLTSITIPNSVTSIGYEAFYLCSGLTSVTIPDSVTSIGDDAFRSCNLLKSAIFLGDAPRNVGDDIFYYCADDFTIKVKKGTKGWNGDYTSTALPTTWHGYPIEYATEDDLYPVLDANATAEDVANALSGSVDENLAKNITSVEMYSKYKAWASVVKTPTGEEAAGVEIVMDSPTAWISFALDQSKLIANEPVEGDIAIASLDAVAADGSFEFTVTINQIDVGDGAVEENLKKLFRIEGSTSLGNDANFSSENVEIELAEPVNGDVKFKILPKDSPDSFFIRAKLLK